jgi:glycosyltransferase involved in cell wall biosynthesis
MRQKEKGKAMPPLGVKFHGYEMFQRAPSFKVRLQHWMLRGPTKYNNRLADVVFSYGGYITPLIRDLGVPQNRIIEIPTGIEASWVREEIPPSSNRRQFLFIGRFERRKGVEELNQVLEALKDRNDFDFHFVGPIPPTRLIKSHNITYHGKVMEKEKLQAIVDPCEVLVTPSHSEGMPNVIMEGMARGLAVIATDVGAVPAQVDKQNGWRLAPGDASALQTAMVEAIEMEPAALDQKRRASRQRVLDSFTWESVSAQTVAALQTYLEGNS